MSDSLQFKKGEVAKSKAEAFAMIKELLSAENVDAQFDSLNGDYYSKDKFIVTWIGTWDGIPSEFSIDKCDNFYTACSGNKAIYATRSLVHEKQLGGYRSIERALIDVGMKLCPKNEKKAFFEKYAVPYNERLKKQRDNKNDAD